MIRIILDPDNADPSITMNEVAARGGVKEIAAELSYAIADIYNGMKMRDPKMAIVFKALMGAATHPASPVWTENTTVPGSTRFINVIPKEKK